MQTEASAEAAASWEGASRGMAASLDMPSAGVPSTVGLASTPWASGTAGLLEPHLTGSGSAVFGVVPEGVPVRAIAGRFPGREPLYQVRSMVKGLRIVKLG